MSNKQTTISKDVTNKKIIVVREFNAPVEDVWKAWTDSSILDTWWAPRPWKANTKSMEFREGGRWLYKMAGPDGNGQWCRLDYKKIVPNKVFTAIDAFCDENGNPSGDLPSMNWKNEFKATETGTIVEVEITFDSEADMNKIVEMGFEAGFTMAHGNLDELFEKK